MTPKEWSDQLDRIIDDPSFPPGPLVLADPSTAGGAPRITTDAIDEMARRRVTYTADVRTMQWAIMPDGASDKARLSNAISKDRTSTRWCFNELLSARGLLGVDAERARTQVPQEPAIETPH
ncbi:MAG: hypothetical protein ACLPVY_22690 [Acidimicrobiia bacterium]